MGESDGMSMNLKKTVIALSVILSGSAFAQTAVDVHCHNILPEYMGVLNRHDAAMDENYPLPHWDVESHLAFMDSAGIDCSVLSMPVPQPYFGDTEECSRIVRFYNEYCAGLKKKYPGKFKFCAALPLPDVESAIDEAIYALDSLGADGIKLATNSRGLYLGDMALDPLMEVLDKRNAVVIIHPHKPVPVNDSLIATTPLAMYEYPAETTRAVVNMISRNVLARYPNIKMVVPHCGSFLPLAIPRMKGIHPAMVAKGIMQPIDWEGNLSRLYYDLAGGASPETVKMMLTITTPDKILYGSDYPYLPDNVLIANKERMYKQFSADPDLAPYVEQIFSDNAHKLFSSPK